MKAVSFRRAFHILPAMLALSVSPATLAAQTATVAGRVTSTAGQALGGASVGIPTLQVGTVTDMEGRYSFTVDVARAGGRPVYLVTKYIGYKPKRVGVTLTTGRIAHDVVLERDILDLEAVVVTGVSEATSQQKTPFTVAVVDQTSIKEAPGTSPLASLSGKIAGASVVTTSGQPGAEPAVRLRSPTSLTGRQDPLVIVDGTITRLGLADVNSEDIERIEVIKGAAASSLYGSDAANGVIQIFTRRGANLAEGQTMLTLRSEFGTSYLPRKLEGNMAHNYELNPDGSFKLDANGNRTPEADRIADNEYPVYFDNYDEVFKPGMFMTNYVSVGQRQGASNYNASFQNTRESGVLNLLNGYGRQNFRVNADQALTDNLDVSMGAFYGRSHADQGEDTGIFFGMRFLEPNVNLTAPSADGKFQYNPAIKQAPLSGNLANPLYELSQQQVSNDRDRFTGTFKTTYRPLSWLTADANVGYDKASINYKAFVPVGHTNSSGAVDKGSLFHRSNSDQSYNLGSTLTASTSFRTWFRNTTKAAWIYEDQTNSFVSVNAPALTVPRVTEFTAAAQDPNNPVGPASRTERIRNQNYFVVTTFDIKDRYVLDGLVRQDQSSLFGAKARKHTYHRLSAAYRVSEDLKIPGVDELKLRASHGTAGLRPVFSAQYETFSVVGGSPEKVNLGNEDLKPAFSKEDEFGFNINVLRNYTMEYTYSKKTTSDQILNVPVSASTGYRSQWINGGSLEGSSHEAAFGAILLSKRDMFWRLNITADRTRQRITDLKVGSFLVGPSSLTDNTKIFRIAKGEPFGIIYGAQWIRSEAQLQETIGAGKLTGTAADYIRNEEGFYVRRVDHRTVNEQPLKYFNSKGEGLMAIGDVNPDFNMGLSSNAQWKALSLSTQLNWVKGGNIYNYTRQWPFNEFRDPVIDQRHKPQAERKPTTYYSTFYNNFDTSDYFVEDGSYVRLRELAVNISLPEKWVGRFPVGNFRTARFGVVGRNLWTSTDYSGYDPDVTGPGGGNPFAYRVDYFTYPAFRTFTAMLELGF